MMQKTRLAAAIYDMIAGVSVRSMGVPRRAGDKVCGDCVTNRRSRETNRKTVILCPAGM
jgi:hypothetical protein